MKKYGLVSGTDQSLRKKSRTYPKNYKPSSFLNCGTKAKIRCGNACQQQIKVGTIII